MYTLQYKHFKHISSTHLMAKEHKEDFSPEYIWVISTDFQTKGIGRKLDPWVSENASSLLVSFAFFFSSEKKDVLIFVLATIIHTILQKYGVHATFKWPNDIYIHDKKICGMMQDIDQDFIVVSYGLNVNNTEEYFNKMQLAATSLYIEKHQIFSRSALLEEIANAFYEKLLSFSETSLVDIQNYFHEYLLWKHQRVKIGDIEGIFCGIDENFHALLQSKDRLVSVSSGSMQPIII